MALHFLPDGPALVIEHTERILVIADLHIGIESDLDVHGVHIPSQTRGRLDRVLACIDEGKPDLVLLLGDVKHSVPLATRQEYFEIPELLREIRSRAPLRVVPGNHDGGLERFLEKGELLPKRGALIDGIGYLHGHTYPDPSLLGHLLVIGHHHPMVTLRDEVGCALRDRAYLLTSVDEECLGIAGVGGGEGEDSPTRVLVMPAFNEFTGFDITRIQESGLGPLSRCMDFPDAEVFLTDGTYLGLLGSLGEE
ncbi:MAG: metallophosphoesterase [Methanomicrobiales archaeon]|nr:metallophosphoesterase [Methanomicrobiales archaeon]MDD1668573.1 metallophosphoesterase [Methanomicrobiales archaeon]